jgi:hypothetical protein
MARRAKPHEVAFRIGRIYAASAIVKIDRTAETGGGYRPSAVYFSPHLSCRYRFANLLARTPA